MEVTMPSTTKILATLAFAAAVALPAQVLAQGSEITVEAAVARAIEDRQPVDAGTTFSADVGQLYVWTNVMGAEGHTISHVWMHGGNEWAVELSIGANRWRTWSSKVIVPEWTGQWTVEVRDQDGTVLETVTFTVGAEN
jgi:hypothetical protein